jgi:tripartite-type tricarboxylate transporter receptor subunit TctC
VGQGTLIALFMVVSAAAQDYPNRPVRVILPTPAGSTPDVTARLVAPALSKVLGQQLVLDNRSGAGGMIAAELAAKAVPDGYTLSVGTPGALAIMPHMRPVPYDSLRDFAPIGLISIGPFLLITHPSVPVRSVKDLIALAKAKPGQLNYASAGNGVANHLAMELFKQMTSVNIVHVPYKGAPQAVTDVLGGQMHMMFNSIAPVLPHVRAERVRTLGIASPKRSPQLPDVPTIAEAGVPGYEATTWTGVVAPVGMPRAIVMRLNAEINKMVASPSFKDRVAPLGSEPMGGTPEQFRDFIRSEHAKWGDIVRRAGAKID